MIKAFEIAGTVLLVATFTAGLAGCGTAAKEKTAPCKRPANMTSYAEDPRHDCGPMTSVNGEPSAALAAIGTIATE
ncbi:hypothetical protein GOZ78_23335 [Agrobacterium vitis]|uniref:Lipoprotein n=2 Tax=Rhizobium/Agrobacterium group TaxID=227290 RepID=B9K5Z2_ALLAM|nr:MULTISPECIES: hypothetical protein [Rhizobium/Agrobacterium group]MCF1450021.1 hypothetical protein [Allorhizobium ampelinum]MQB13107.1 hypothetical protein [Agrobacterium sp. ICMP 6402]ACM40290.1 conserved hypothetical protein [Allorhizobium ampelinum S4]MCE6077535.1 hypothetical protein [Agrobacterium vitis]MUO31594.1 hypothetical protein [Agrobacterium vitis]